MIFFDFNMPLRSTATLTARNSSVNWDNGAPTTNLRSGSRSSMRWPSTVLDLSLAFLAGARLRSALLKSGQCC